MTERTNFFQAEDGIRDYKVTGVQTCALPISTSQPRPSGVSLRTAFTGSSTEPISTVLRSEERRVGKECRSRRAPYHSKKNFPVIKVGASIPGGHSQPLRSGEPRGGK